MPRQEDLRTEVSPVKPQKEGLRTEKVPAMPEVC
jgi:hypothetical protein